jgi:hypothetical protein
LLGGSLGNPDPFRDNRIGRRSQQGQVLFGPIPRFCAGGDVSQLPFPSNTLDGNIKPFAQFMVGLPTELVDQRLRKLASPFPAASSGHRRCTPYCVQRRISGVKGRVTNNFITRQAAGEVWGPPDFRIEWDDSSSPEVVAMG